MYYRKESYENIEKATFKSCGEYDFPIIAPEIISINALTGFNYAKTEKDKSKGIHFFIDDYQFIRIWRFPEQYVDLLKQYSCVLSPDFSLYTDFPIAMQIYNHYRNNWIAAYWQAMGIKVIPTISWSDERSFKWVYDGMPQGATVAVSSVGTQNSKAAQELFIAGYTEMIRRLNPSNIIFYGKIPEECTGNITHIKSFSEKFKEAKCNGW